MNSDFITTDSLSDEGQHAHAAISSSLHRLR
jgi:hypothetical protein